MPHPRLRAPEKTPLKHFDSDLAPSPRHQMPIQLSILCGCEVAVVPQQGELAAHVVTTLLEPLEKV